LCLLLLLPLTVFAGTVTTGIDEEARLPYWQYADDGISVRFVQRLPDQTRGFFQARGFTAAHAERIAQSCVFQTVFRNTSQATKPGPVNYDLRDWAVSHDGGSQGMKVREDWAAEWQDLGVAQPARIAFEWALFPTVQTYNPGDYNWGMSIFNLAPGAPFDLRLSWTQHGETRTAVIPDMQCAEDIEMEALPE